MSEVDVNVHPYGFVPDVDVLTAMEWNKRPLYGGLRQLAYGGVGCGKTLWMIIEDVRFATKHYHEGYPIFSNVDLCYTDKGRELFSHVFHPIKRARDLVDINEPCKLDLDETWSLAMTDSPSDMANRFLLTILLRSSKKGWVVNFTVQWWKQLIKRIRYITEVYVEPRMRGCVLYEDLYGKTGVFIRSRRYDARPYGELFDTTMDVMTLNIEDIKCEYENMRRKKGLSVDG